jgi:hypothetical protein
MIEAYIHDMLVASGAHKHDGDHEHGHEHGKAEEMEETSFTMEEV